jgi:4-hydroxybenzoate polyprenyltransferase
MKWLHFILSHSIFIAVCAVALTFQTTLLLRLDTDPFVYGFIFFGTLFSYNFYWLLSKISFASAYNIRGLLKKETRSYLILLISFVGLLFCFLRTSIPMHFVIAAMVLTIIYAVPLLPVPALQFTRKAGVLKTVLLAFTWTYVTVAIPLQKDYMLLNNADLFITSRRFLFMLMLCIIFDNRDKDMDKIRGLRSLATDIPPVTLRILIYLIFALLFTSNFFYGNFGVTLPHSIALQISTIALLTVYFYANKKQGYLFYYFFVDGMMLFSALATYIAGI